MTGAIARAQTVEGITWGGSAEGAIEMSVSAGTRRSFFYRAIVCPVAEGAIWWIHVRRPFSAHQRLRDGVVAWGYAWSRGHAMDEAQQIVLWLCHGRPLRIRVGGERVTYRPVVEASR